MGAPPVIYALDFDGVLCDSVGESALSSFRGLVKVWPELMDPESALSPPSWAVSAMRAVRPVIETGYENLVLVRTLLELGESKADGFIESMLAGDWPAERDSLMDKYGVSKQALVDAFNSARDEWIAEDLEGWLGANRMFPGVVDALNFAATDVFIITTKEARFAKLLLESAGVRGIAEERIYGQGTGSKISVLKKIIAMPESAGRTVVFVEDRYETLEAVSISMLGQPLELLLAIWGYNTEKSKEIAEMHPFINLLDLPTFVSKLQ